MLGYAMLSYAMLCYNTYSGYTADVGEYWRVYVHIGTLTNRFTYRDVLHEDIIMKSSELSFWSSRWDEFFFCVYNDIYIHMYEVSTGISGMRNEICGNQIGMYISDRMWIKSKIFILISINVVLNEMQLGGSDVVGEGEGLIWVYWSVIRGWAGGWRSDDGEWDNAITYIFSTAVVVYPYKFSIISAECPYAWINMWNINLQN